MNLDHIPVLSSPLVSGVFQCYFYFYVASYIFYINFAGLEYLVISESYTVLSLPMQQSWPLLQKEPLSLATLTPPSPTLPSCPLPFFAL